MRLWIDIATAPHATFFKPIAEELTARGVELVITAWDRGQAAELATSIWPDTVVTRGSFKRSRFAKGTTMWSRALELRGIVGPRRVDAAVGHNSYSQIVASRMLKVPSVTMMDYEHQPANHVAFRLASRVMIPDCVPVEALRRFGAKDAKLIRYPFLKEEVALSDFRPDPSWRASVDVPDDRPLVTLRPPAEGALYHRGGNPLFETVLRALGSGDFHVLVSPRTRSQGEELASFPGIRVMTSAVSGADLLYHSDLFVGAGGTMTREAAVLGTRTYSVFAGKSAAVDRELIRRGKLMVLSAGEDLDTSSIALRKERPWAPTPQIKARFVDLLLDGVRDAGVSLERTAS